MEHNAPLTFYPLSVLHDGQDIMVGRPDRESYAHFPDDAAALLQQLKQGMHPEQAARWYEQQYGEPVDIEDFVTTLRELQFIKDEGEEDASGEPERTISFQWLGRAVFSPLAWIVYSMLFSACFFALIRFPVLVPSSQDLFFSPSLTLIEVALLIAQVLAILFHESYHVLAGRRLGLPTRISIGHRLGTIVLETSLTSLWTVPRRSRYLPLLAGMLADSLVFSACIMVAWTTMPSLHAVSPVGRFCLAVAYITLLRMVWQCSFYLRTDLYYVIVTALGCVDLQNTTRAYVRNLLFMLLGRRDRIEDESHWHARDRQVVRWYAPIYFSGYAISIGLLIVVGVPLTIQLLHAMLAHLIHGILADPRGFLDTTTFLTLNLLPWVILTVSIARKFQQRNVQRQEALYTSVKK